MQSDLSVTQVGSGGGQSDLSVTQVGSGGGQSDLSVTQVGLTGGWQSAGLVAQVGTSIILIHCGILGFCSQVGPPLVVE
jgi:hypothetical protein